MDGEPSRFGGADRRPKDPVSGPTGFFAAASWRLRTKRWRCGSATSAATQWKPVGIRPPCSSSEVYGAGPGATKEPARSFLGRNGSREGVVAGTRRPSPRRLRSGVRAPERGGGGPVEEGFGPAKSGGSWDRAACGEVTWTRKGCGSQCQALAGPDFEPPQPRVLGPGHVSQSQAERLDRRRGRYPPAGRGPRKGSGTCQRPSGQRCVRNCRAGWTYRPGVRLLQRQHANRNLVVPGSGPSGPEPPSQDLRVP